MGQACFHTLGSAEKMNVEDERQRGGRGGKTPIGWDRKMINWTSFSAEHCLPEGSKSLFAPHFDERALLARRFCFRLRRLIRADWTDSLGTHVVKSGNNRQCIFYKYICTYDS